MKILPLPRGVVGEIFDSTDDQYEFWFALFESILDEHAPRKKMRIRDKDMPYMTNESGKELSKTKENMQKCTREIGHLKLGS